LTAALSILAASAIPALAAPAVQESIKNQGTTAADVCSPSGGSTVGHVHINRRGLKDGGKRFHFQVKLTNGAPSETYTLKVYTVTGAGIFCVSTLELTSSLKTNSQGHGVKNLKFNVDLWTEDIVVLLEDPDGVNNDLATARFQLSPP
jgi:hypothetical protein